MISLALRASRRGTFVFIGLLAVLLLAVPGQARSNYKMKLSDPLPENLFVELAKKINPTVVNISTVVSPQMRDSRLRRQQDPFWEFFEQFMGPQGRHQQQPRRGQSIGTGFIIDPSGLIVTNSHVVRASDHIEVQLIGDEETFYTAEVIGDDPRFDIALIKINTGKPLPYAELGDSEKVEVGEWVAAFGNPYGHSFSMSKGIISAKQRKITELSPIPFLQTDASINPGNSGGPLVNTQGKVIGVNTAIDARAQGIGFAIPINELKKIRSQLEKNGRVLRGYIGVNISEITLRAKEALKLKDFDGALILDVEPGGPAEQAGVEPYDVVRQFGKTKINSSNDLVNAVKDTSIGKAVTTTVIRNGVRKKLKVKVGSPPGERVAQRSQRRRNAPKSSADKFNAGLTIENSNAKLRRLFKISKNSPRGPIVTDVVHKTPAWRAGLRKGDIILDVNQTKVSKATEVFEALKRGDNLLRVHNEGRTHLVFLKLR